MFKMVCVAGLFIVAAFVVAAGQNRADEKSAKQQEKQAKEAAKAEKKRKEAEWRERTILLKDVRLFPQSYVGKFVRITSVAIDEIQPYTEAGQVYYFLAVADVGGSESTFAMPTIDGVAFVTGEAIARELASRSGYKDYGLLYRGEVKPIVDIWFEVVSTSANSRMYYIAKVNCVVFRGLKSSNIGQCQM